MNILMAGPWRGEFGWELCRWQGRVRRYAHTNKKYDAVVVGILEGHEILYKDFATDFLYFPADNHCEGWMLKNLKNPMFSDADIGKIRLKYGTEPKIDLYMPTKHNTGMTHADQDFIKFGDSSKITEKFDLIFHARWCNKRKTNYRDWSVQKWTEVAEYFKGKLSMASIGTRVYAKPINHTVHLLGISLENLVNIMAAAKLIIGPSSGPMHLASLCGLTHLVWTDNRRWGGCHGTNRERYETKWNPLKTKSIILDDCNWNPQVSTVIKTIKEHFGL